MKIKPEVLDVMLTDWPPRIAMELAPLVADCGERLAFGLLPETCRHYVTATLVEFAARGWVPASDLPQAIEEATRLVRAEARAQLEELLLVRSVAEPPSEPPRPRRGRKAKIALAPIEA